MQQKKSEEAETVLIFISKVLVCVNAKLTGSRLSFKNFLLFSFRFGFQ
jgi:hypothetical protein